MSWLEMH